MRRKLMFLCLLILGISANIWAADANDTHPFSVQDMQAMERLSEPRVSPDGKWVVFTLRQTDLEADCGHRDLWLMGTDGAGLRQLTSHPSDDSSPQWAPDGKSIYFLSTRSDTSHVWRIPVDGGEAEQITALPVAIDGFVLSPDGSRLALAMKVFPDCENLACTKSKLAEIAQRKTSGRIYDELFIRHWDTWSDGRRSHVFAMPISGGEPVDMMKLFDTSRWLCWAQVSHRKQ